MDARAPILFYDGECGFCARSVRWILRHDRRGEIRFAPLQGATYASIEAPGKPTDLDTMVLADERGLRVRSDAWVGVLRRMGGAWPALGLAMAIVPRPVRDWGYGLVARHRRRLPGKGGACPVPSDAQRARMLG